jgi:hypothetical protein
MNQVAVRRFLTYSNKNVRSGSLLVSLSSTTSTASTTQTTVTNGQQQCRFASSDNRPVLDEVARTGMTPEERARYYAAGIVDERALLNFNTLHEMQSRACTVFSKKNLFSTYNPETKQFEWMTYKECTFTLLRKYLCFTILLLP